MWRPVGPALHHVLPRERLQLGRGEDDGILRELRGVHVVSHRLPVPQHRLAPPARRIRSAIPERLTAVSPVFPVSPVSRRICQVLTSPATVLIRETGKTGKTGSTSVKRKLR